MLRVHRVGEIIRLAGVRHHTPRAIGFTTKVDPRIDGRFRDLIAPAPPAQAEQLGKEFRVIA